MHMTKLQSWGFTKNRKLSKKLLSLTVYLRKLIFINNKTNEFYNKYN